MIRLMQISYSVIQMVKSFHSADPRTTRKHHIMMKHGYIGEINTRNFANNYI